jgi:two-component system nitrogen regulation response regulator NtrX
MTGPMRILVVDDESEIRESLQEILEEDGHEPVAAATIAQARERAARGIDLAIVDIMLGAQSGMELLKWLRAEMPLVPVIMISGQGTVALTAEAFRLGAHDFMEKPLRLVQVRASVRNALEAVRLKNRVAEQGRKEGAEPVFASAIMKNVFAQVKRLAGLGGPVVILGPSGSGKELVARGLHYEGSRAGGPFIATNAASLPLNLAEDELFGHERGAFTGAHSRRIGSLEHAHGGTLFLDEIADMDVQIQAKLLRVLESGEITRLGGSAPVRVNVRVISATHQDLEARVRAGAFRQDLWFRLCAFVIRVPSLQERPEDIPVLAAAFLRKVCAEMGFERSFTSAALQRLGARAYPGNVRELRHIVTRAAVYADGIEIDPCIIDAVAGASLAPNAAEVGSAYYALDFREARERFERDYLHAALQRHGGNISATAGAIGMAQSNLSRKLKELELR